jgi:hypothetical protein
MTVNDIFRVSRETKAKGRSKESNLLEIYAEVAKAAEAVKDGMRTCGDIDHVLNETDAEYFRQKFLNKVKLGTENALAGIIVKVCEFAATEGIDLDKHIRARLRSRDGIDYVKKGIF